MKKTVFIAVLGAASVVASYGQGVFFNNYVASTQTTGVVFGAAAGAYSGKGVGSQFTSQLFYGPNGTSSTGSLQAIGGAIPFVTSVSYPVYPNTTAPGSAIGMGNGCGWFNGNTITFPAYNTTYAMAFFVTGVLGGNTYTGWSAIANVTTQASSSSGIPNLPGSLRATTFAVAPVPEPTTLALAGLGGLAALVAVRRKQS